MADIADALKYANAPETGQIDIAEALTHAGDDTPQPPGPPPTTYDRLKQGFTDTIVGLDRLAQHALPDWTRWGYHNGSFGPDPNSVQQWDQIASKREQDYDQARAAAGQTGIDWWRLAGSALNPLNYVIPGGTAETVAGRIGQAAIQGAGMGATQSAAESTTPGGLWWDAAKGAGLGGLTGGGVGGLVESVMPALRYGVNKIRSMVSDSGTDAIPAAADSVVKNALHQSGIDPNAMNLDVMKGMRQDVQSALEHGADISPESITNRARAESLPVPVRLTRGQATGDPMLFSREQNLRGIQGAGEPITSRLQEQNAAFIQNLDALGAKNAPDPVSFGSTYSGKIQNLWDSLQSRKDALYANVRNAKGQSAAMDGVTAAQGIKDFLDSPAQSHAWDALPANIQRTVEDLRMGDFPLTVAQAQSLDKQWYQAMKGADGTGQYAIGKARQMLMDAPISDELGTEARQAYQAAKQAHAQQMSLIDPKLPNGTPNPNFQPLVKAVVMDGQPPEKLFASHFMNAAPSVGQKNMNFLSQIDPGAPQQVGQTLMGEIKRGALNSSSDERGTVSEASLRGWANDPVKSARMDALLPAPAVNTFRNLASTVEAAKKFPVASTVNTSNTGSALFNAGMSALKNSALGQIGKRLPLARDITEGMNAAKMQSEVQSSLNPGVTLKSLLTATPSQAFNRRLITRIGIPGAIASEQSANGSNE